MHAVQVRGPLWTGRRGGVTRGTRRSDEGDEELATCCQTTLYRSVQVSRTDRVKSIQLG